MIKRLRPLIVVLLSLLVMPISAQRFFNLTQPQVSVGDHVPLFTHSIPLFGAWQDSIYTATILYPEFIDMTLSDVARLHSLTTDSFPALPEVRQRVAVERKQGALEVLLCPVVKREGRYQLLVSFMLRIDAAPRERAAKAKLNPVIGEQERATSNRSLSTSNGKAALASGTGTSGSALPWASHSRLASGRWVKVRVPSSGFYQLTSAAIRGMGFTDLSKVRVYGYGGNLINETLRASELTKQDDLPEVPTAMVEGRRVFYALGPVSWSSATALRRTRNPYSDYGYYFITQTDEPAVITDSATLVNAHYPSADDYHALYERDGYSWYHGGRNLFDPEPTAVGKHRVVTLPNKAQATTGRLSVSISAGVATRAAVFFNGKKMGDMGVSLGEYDRGNSATVTYSVQALQATDTVRIEVLSGGPMRLDYVSMAYDKPLPRPSLAATLPSPEVVGVVSPQDRHADPQADMVIIIPSSGKLLTQAQRLAAHHQQRDGLRVNIVPANELYNEFSSGTPDASAYRRYLKMLYDRAETEADLPRHLLLMGDCLWDNRLLTAECKGINPDDVLLCYESENSFNEVECYVDDGFFALLDEGEGANPLSADKLDVGVGRFPVTTPEEAKIMVDKTIDYANNKEAGAWQNTLFFMGDDGDNNLHMRDENFVADDVMSRFPHFLGQKVMWDAYEQTGTARGMGYPNVTEVIKRQQQRGALIMDYAGHGAETIISHEFVLMLNDFQQFTNKALPLWITASCDIMPFDGVHATIGEATVLNKNGGAMAFFGTTRTVLASYNRQINHAFLLEVLSSPNGRPITLGEAQRRAKNKMIEDRRDLTCNKLQYSLLGDPALSLQLPTFQAVIDSIGGKAVGQTPMVKIRGGETVSIKGHIVGQPQFTGSVTLTLRDAETTVVCRANPSAKADDPFTFKDRSKVLFQGSDSVRRGQFSFTFTVPKDISYSNATGMINLYAIDQTKQLIANGHEDRFVVGGTWEEANDSTGPKVYAWLCTQDFKDGDRVNATPFFSARISDPDGINVSDVGIGHRLMLSVDHHPLRTYDLTDHFQFDFGSSTQGSVYFTLPELEPGEHTLTFRAWDVLNNSTTTSLRFVVDRTLDPQFTFLEMTDNPARSHTTFVLNHAFQGTPVDVTLEVFDASNRLLWQHTDKSVDAPGAYTCSWNVCTNEGEALPSGIYFLRARLTTRGGQTVSKAKKFVVLGNK